MGKKKEKKKDWRKVHNVDIYMIVLLNMSFTFKKMGRKERKRRRRKRFLERM